MNGRIYRALNERIYLLKAEQGGSNVTQGDQWNFEVRGQSSKVYKVQFVRDGPSKCTCMDFILRCKLCKHLIFITERIAKLTNVTYRMLKKNKLSSEDFCSLSEILRMRLQNVDIKESETVDTSRKVSETSEDCFICFESLQGETLVQCVTTCKNYFHEECLQIWLTKNRTCPLCRAQWIDRIKYVPTTRSNNGIDDALDYLEQTSLKPVIKLKFKTMYSVSSVPQVVSQEATQEWSDEIIG